MLVFSHIVIKELFSILNKKRQWMFGEFLVVPSDDGSLKHLGFHPFYIWITHLSCNKNEIYTCIKFGVPEICRTCAFHCVCMVFVLHFSLLTVGYLTIDSQDLCKDGGVPATTQNTQVSAHEKKRKKKYNYQYLQ